MVCADDFKRGTAIEWNGGVWVVVDFQHIRPGRGAPYVRTRLKNAANGLIVERIFRPTDKMPLASAGKAEQP